MSRIAMVGAVLLGAALAACGGKSPTSPTSSAPAPAPVVRTTVKIMPLGDSITQGNTQHDSYRRPLWQRLQAAGYLVDFVGRQNANYGGPPPNRDFDMDNEGHRGVTTGDVLAEIASMAQASRPDVVLLHLGSNDAFDREDTQQTIGRLGSIIERVRAVNPDVKVLIAQIIPSSSSSLTRRLESINAEIPGLAARTTTGRSPVIVVDQFSGFSGDNDTYDGTHPNTTGEAKMAARWFDAMAGFLLKGGDSQAAALSSRMPAPADDLESGAETHDKRGSRGQTR